MSPSRQCLIAGLVCLGGGLAGAAALGQETPSTFESEASQVRLQVAVFGKKGVPVAGLTPDDFEIFEEGVRQQTGFVFRPDESAVDIAIVLDMSASMADSMAAASAAANELAAALDPTDCLLFLPFAEAIAEPVWVAGGAGVPLITRDAIGEPNKTALTDAILTAQLALRARHVDVLARRMGLPVPSSCAQQSDAQGTRRQLLVVVSDGMDSISRTSWNSILDNVLESQVPVLSIIAGKSRTREVAPWPLFSRRRMETLGVASGGTFERLDSDSYDRMFDRLLQVLRATYVVTFSRTAESRASTAAWRQIEVRVPRHEGKTLAPSGYYTNSAAADRARTSQALAARVLRLGSIDAAVALLRGAADRDPDSWSAQGDLARALELQSVTEEALRFALRATRLRPTTGHEQAARLAVRLGRAEVALEQAIRASQAGQDVDGLLDDLMAKLSAAEIATVRTRLEAPRVYLADTGAGDVQTMLRARETDGVMARLISDSAALALVRDLSLADFYVWFDVEPDARTLTPGRARGRLRLNLPRHVTWPLPRLRGAPREPDWLFARLRARTLVSMRVELGDPMAAGGLEALLRAALEQLEGWIEKRR